jgi:hypothetical protein
MAFGQGRVESLAGGVAPTPLYHSSIRSNLLTGFEQPEPEWITPPDTSAQELPKSHNKGDRPMQYPRWDAEQPHQVEELV